MYDTIREQLKISMKAKDAQRTDVLRSLLAAFSNESVARGGTPHDTLSEEEMLAVVRRLAKQRKDSIDQFRSAGRDDLATAEEAELAILKEFLPAELDEEAIRTIVREVCDSLEEVQPSAFGAVMGAVIKRTMGNADGAVVKRLVDAEIKSRNS